MPKKSSKSNIDHSFASNSQDDVLREPIINLSRKRDILKSKLIRFGTFLNTLKSSEPSSAKLVELDTRLKDLESHLILDFNNVQFELEGIDFERYKENNEDSFENLYYQTISDAKHYIFSFSNPPGRSIQSVNTTSSSSKSINAKLPIIELPKFSGVYDRWLEFKELFVSLIHNADYLDLVQKFDYLRASLEGTAAQCIQYIEISGSNYELAWNALCQRYDNKNLMVHNYIKSLFNIPELKPDSSTALRNIVDCLSKNLRSLEAIGVKTESWDPLIVYLVTSKFDSETIREWEQHDTEGEMPTISELKDFLSSRADFLEKVNMHKSKVKINPSYSNVKPRIKSFSSNLNLKPTFACYYCKQPHSIYKCQDFLSLPFKERKEKIQALKLCVNYLQKGHTLNDCRSGKCRHCSEKHNSLLHSNVSTKTSLNVSNASSPRQGQDSESESDLEQVNNKLQVSTSCNLSCQDQVLLATALIEVVDTQGHSHICRALLDSGSMSNFISEDLARKLNIKQELVDISVSGINQAQSHVSRSCNIQFKSLNSNFETNIPCLILSKITDNLPSVSISPQSLLIPPYITLADPDFHKPGQVDILIGAGTFWKLLCKGTKQLGVDRPVLQKSKLGWYISGSLGSIQPRKVVSQFTRNLDVQSQLSKFWEIEEVSPGCRISDEEQQAEIHFKETFRRNDEGRFVVSVPLKDSISKLGETRETAKRQFFSLEKRFSSNPKLKQMYTDFMNEYKDLNHMSSFEPLDNQVTFYSPHHGVLREDSVTTKLRVVFNSSCPSSSGVSYNSLQMVGPTVQEDLLSILLRFRQHSYVISADICKMYRQILISEEFRPLQIILWRSSPDQELKTFSLDTVVYGTASAPFLATRCLLQLAKEYQSTHSQAAEVIQRDFYVDGLLSGTDSVEEAIKVGLQVRSILASAGFDLRKWKSNSIEVLAGIKASSSSTDDFYFCPLESCKTLGMLWSSKNDTLSFHLSSTSYEKRITKRIILSDTAKIFDPLGLLSPIVVRAKILLQKLWSQNLSWDEEVPRELASMWSAFRSELSDLNLLQIPRHVKCNSPLRVELHGFSDASQQAYGACIYIRATDSTQNVYVQLLASKSRVAPLKSISIPRLELCAALLLAQLFSKVMSSVTLKIVETQFWCDSTVVLAWIRSSPHNFQVFVGNRVSEIQNLTSNKHWRYVPTDQNPADIVSRGMSPKGLLSSSIWFSGPDWLNKSPCLWPSDPTVANPIVQDELPEVRKNVHNFVQINQNELFPFNKFSSLNRIKRVMAYTLRFINNCRLPKGQRSLAELSIDDLRKATNKLIILAQHESFAKDLHELNKTGLVSAKSNLLSLTPFLKDNIIRVGGRLKHSAYSFEKKHPALLSNKHHLTYLILASEHNKLFHCGPQLLLINVREHYWPISGKNLAKRIVKECIVCFRFKPRFVTPIMGDLPEPRVSPRPPFTHVGVDYAGPFYYKDRKGRGAKTFKCYLCLFICLTVKAVHLELVTELSTASFLEAFQRFIARRGKPSHVYSDNGSNFVGASNKLKELGQFLKSNKSNLVHKLGDDINIKWSVIASYSPHQGGLWEAGIKSAKHHLLRLLNNSSPLTFENFSTIISQVESVLNSRPLTPLSTDPNDLSALTPSHFLIGRSSQSLPHPDLQTTPTNRLSLFENLEKLKQHFWQRWSGEYVTQLQQRQKWRQHQQNLSIGDMVLIHDSDLPPYKWRLGRVSAMHPGSDGIVRVASVKTASGIIKRAVVKLAPLPLDPTLG